MLSKIKIFFKLPNTHKFIFIKIVLLVPLIEFVLKTLKFKRTFNLLKFFVKKKYRKKIENESNLVHCHANYLYRFQKNFPFFGKCLARSLTLWFLLARKGINTEMRFGMKKENGKLLAHSWLEFDGTPLEIRNEKEEKFTPFPKSILKEISGQT